MASIPGRLRSRQPNLADLAILILATGCGLAVVRHQLPSLFSAPHITDGGWATPIYLSRAVAIEPVLMAWNLAWLGLYLRRPRPVARRLVRQPGFRSCFAATLVVLVSGPLSYSLIRFGSSGANPEMEQTAWSEVLSAQIGLAVLTSWALMLMGGRWRNWGWLDGGGSVLGILWILLIPVNLTHLFWYNGWL